MTKTTNKDWSIEFNFEIPKTYRRTFYLKDQDCLLTLKVVGKRITFKSEGGCGSERLNHHLDWLEECLCSVRSEFGQ